MNLSELPLSQVLSFYNGSKPPELVDEGYPVFGSNGRIGAARTFNHENSVILGRVGAYCGSVEFCEGKFWASDNTIVVKPLDGFDTKYLYYSLKNQPLRSYAGGAAQPLITHGILRPIKAKYHQYDGQVRIAAILSAYDDLIDNNRRLVVLLEDAARQLYKEWFVRFRFPGHEHRKMIDGLPDGWERTAFREIATVKKGRNITRENAVDGPIPVVAGGLSPAYYHDTPNVIGSAVTISASGANAGHVGYYQVDVWASDCSYLSKADNKHLRYLYLLLKHRQFDLTGMQKGAAQPHVYPKDIDRLEVLKAPEELVSQFVGWIDPLFDQVANLNRQIEQLAKTRDILLPKLMSGAITA